MIDSEDKRIKSLKWLKIGDVWGIGNRYAKRLKYKSINTAYDFINLPDIWVRKEMSVVGATPKMCNLLNCYNSSCFLKYLKVAAGLTHLVTHVIKKNTIGGRHDDR